MIEGIPSPPVGLFWRLWSAYKKNPCSIEFLEKNTNDGELWIRIRNDSDQPIQLFGVNFYVLKKEGRNFELAFPPLVWMLSERTQQSLDPGHSFEHPAELNEYEGNLRKLRIEVVHNRSKFPEVKTHKIKPIA